MVERTKPRRRPATLHHPPTNESRRVRRCALSRCSEHTGRKKGEYGADPAPCARRDSTPWWPVPASALRLIVGKSNGSGRQRPQSWGDRARGLAARGRRPSRWRGIPNFPGARASPRSRQPFIPIALCLVVQRGFGAGRGPPIREMYAFTPRTRACRFLADRPCRPPSWVKVSAKRLSGHQDPRLSTAILRGLRGWSMLTSTPAGRRPWDMTRGSGRRLSLQRRASASAAACLPQGQSAAFMARAGEPRPPNHALTFSCAEVDSINIAASHFAMVDLATQGRGGGLAARRKRGRARRRVSSRNPTDVRDLAGAQRRRHAATQTAATVNVLRPEGDGRTRSACSRRLNYSTSVVEACDPAPDAVAGAHRMARVRRSSIRTTLPPRCARKSLSTAGNCLDIDRWNSAGWRVLRPWQERGQAVNQQTLA